VLPHDDVEVIAQDWLSALVVATCLKASAAGPMLYYPTDLIQHAGVLLGVAGSPDHAFRLHEALRSWLFRARHAGAGLLVPYGCLPGRPTAGFRDCGRVRDRLSGGVQRCRPVYSHAPQRLASHLDAGKPNSITTIAHVRGRPEPQRKAQYMRDVELMRSRWRAILGSDPYSIQISGSIQAASSSSRSRRDLPYPPSFTPEEPATASDSRTAALA